MNTCISGSQTGERRAVEGKMDESSINLIYVVTFTDENKNENHNMLYWWNLTSTNVPFAEFTVGDYGVVIIVLKILPWDVLASDNVTGALLSFLIVSLYLEKYVICRHHTTKGELRGTYCICLLFICFLLYTLRSRKLTVSGHFIRYTCADYAIQHSEVFSLNQWHFSEFISNTEHCRWAVVQDTE